MKSLSIVTLALAIIAFSVSFVAGYLQIYNSSRISELKKEQKKISEDLINIQQQLAKSWKSEQGHAGNAHNSHPSKDEWPKYYDAKAVVKFKTENRIVVDQEEIPGFMRAMMMSYKVENPEQLDKLAEEDNITLRLKETETDLTVVGIIKTDN